MKIDPPQISFRFKFRNEEDFPASVVLLLGPIELRGFSIRRSKFEGKDYVVYPPTVRSGAGWLKIFYTSDKKLWVKLEKEILDSFLKEFTGFKKDDMNPEEITF